MTHGRRICNTLKEIRQQIADKNEIEYTTSKCHFEGECQGTCPKCESEVKYLENELYRRTQLGKTVAVVGISLGMVGTFSTCDTPQQANIPPIFEQEQKKIITETTDTVIPLTIPYKKRQNIQNFIAKDITKILDTFVVKGVRFIVDVDVTGMNVIQGQFAETCSFEETELKFIRKNLKYPKKAKKRGIEGIVVIEFLVETDGSLSNFKILESVHPLLDKEALRVLKSMPKWKQDEQWRIPGLTLRYIVPVTFSLDEIQKNHKRTQKQLINH